MEDVLERWRSEKTAGYLSAAVAAAEPDPGKAALFREMADAAEEQAGILAKELHETPPFSPRSGRVSRPFSLGPSAPAPCAPSSRPQRSAVCQSIAARCRPDIRGPLPSRTWVAVTNLMAAARSGQGCSTSTTGSCPIPVAGAAAEPSVLILTGVAGLLAGAFSMAAGEFISMLSQKEMFEHQIAQELWQRSSAWRLAHTLDRHGGRGGDLRDRVAVQRRGALIARPSLPDHWTTVINSAEFGTDYYTRTAVAKSNIFINRPRETRYFYQDLDKRGARLTGVERYTVTGRSPSTTSITSSRRTSSTASPSAPRAKACASRATARLSSCADRAPERGQGRELAAGASRGVLPLYPRLLAASPDRRGELDAARRGAGGLGARAGFTANRPGLSHARLSTRRGRDRMLNATFTVFSNTPGKFHGGDRP
jgi:hypothetical protein